MPRIPVEEIPRYLGAFRREVSPRNLLRAAGPSELERIAQGLGERLALEQPAAARVASFGSRVLPPLSAGGVTIGEAGSRSSVVFPYSILDEATAAANALHLPPGARRDAFIASTAAQKTRDYVIHEATHGIGAGHGPDFDARFDSLRESLGRDYEGTMGTLREAWLKRLSDPDKTRPLMLAGATLAGGALASSVEATEPDYEALARKFGGSSGPRSDAESRATDYDSLAARFGGRPAEAGTRDEKRPAVVTPDVRPEASPYRPPSNPYSEGGGMTGLDYASDPEGLRRAAKAGALGLAATGLALGSVAAPAAVGTAVRIASHPAVAGTTAGLSTLATTGSVPTAVSKGIEAAMLAKGGDLAFGALGRVLPKVIPRSVSARIAHLLKRAAKTESTGKGVAQTVDSTASRSYAGGSSVPAGAADDAALAAYVEREAARSAGSARPTAPAPVAPTVATPVAAPVAAPRRTLPEKGNVTMATVHTRPAGLPPTQSEAARVLRESGRHALKEEQKAAAEAAGVDIAEAFGRAPAGQAAETALETQLRASLLMRSNPKALADEVAERVVTIRSVKPDVSDATLAKEIRALYGFTDTDARKMVDLVLSAMK